MSDLETTKVRRTLSPVMNRLVRKRAIRMFLSRIDDTSFRKTLLLDKLQCDHMKQKAQQMLDALEHESFMYTSFWKIRFNCVKHHDDDKVNDLLNRAATLTEIKNHQEFPGGRRAIRQEMEHLIEKSAELLQTL
jgi:hypothetical protein